MRLHHRIDETKMKTDKIYHGLKCSSINYMIINFESAHKCDLKIFIAQYLCRITQNIFTESFATQKCKLNSLFKLYVA